MPPAIADLLCDRAYSVGYSAVDEPRERRSEGNPISSRSDAMALVHAKILILADDASILVCLGSSKLRTPQIRAGRRALRLSSRST
jgi:hypothetical protein